MQVDRTETGPLSGTSSDNESKPLDQSSIALAESIKFLQLETLKFPYTYVAVSDPLQNWPPSPSIWVGFMMTFRRRQRIHFWHKHPFGP